MQTTGIRHTPSLPFRLTGLLAAQKSLQRLAPRFGAMECCHHPGRLLVLRVSQCQLSASSLVAGGSLCKADLGGLGGHVIGVYGEEAAEEGRAQDCVG